MLYAVLKTKHNKHNKKILPYKNKNKHKFKNYDF